MRKLLLVAVAALAAFSASAAVTGIVVARNGRAVANATVTLYALETPAAQFDRLLAAKGDRAFIAHTRVRDDGSFVIDAKSDSFPAVLHVSAPGFIPSSRLIAEDEVLGSIALIEAESRNGRVSAAGKGVAEARVTLFYEDTEHVTTTDRNGRFTAPWSELIHRVIVVHPAHPVLTAPAPAHTGVGFDFDLPSAVALQGRVVGTDGKTPASGATIRVNGWALARTGDDGTFDIANAPADWSFIFAEHAGGLAFHAATAGAPATLRLEPATEISGRILDSETKRGVRGATVHLYSRTRMSPMQSSVLTDAKGAFTIAALQPTDLAVSHPAYILERTNAGDGSDSRDILLTRLARVSGVVMDADRTAVPGAVVMPWSTNTDSARFSTFVTKPVRTDVDGRFSLRVSPREKLSLNVVATGRPDARSESFTLAPGEALDDLIVTIPGGVRVTGRVSDRDGNPLAGIDVRPKLSGDRQHFDHVIERFSDAVRSGSDGSYALHVLEGTWDFSFSGNGWPEQTVRAQRVSASDANVVDVSLDPAVEIHGRVTRNGTALEGALVQMREGENRGVRTRGDGSFTLTGLTAGEHEVVIFRDGIRKLVGITAPARDVVFDLPAGGSVSGRVVDKTTGQALETFRAGHQINRSGPHGAMGSSPSLRPFENSDGSFTLEHLREGVVEIVADAPGYAKGKVVVTIEEGKALEGITLALERGSRLIGRVTNPAGAPLPDVRVQAISSGRGGYTSSDNAAVTGPSGDFTIEGLAPGAWQVELSHPAFPELRKSVTVRDPETRLDVALEEGVAFSGTVVESNGTPVVDAEVYVMSFASSMNAARTDLEGRFAFDRIVPGHYRVSVTKQGLVPAMLDDFEVAAGRTLRVQLEEGAAIHGRVTGLTPEELATANVQFMGGATSERVAVGPDGSYRIEGVPAGAVRLRAVVSGRALQQRSSSSQTVEVTLGATLVHDIHFTEGVVVEGTVRQNGQPLPAATVSFSSDRANGGMISVTADENGHYRAAGLTPGAYTVEVLDTQRFAGHRTAYEVVTSSRFDIDFTTASFRGRVTDAATGEPIAGATVELRRGWEEFGSARSDMSGVFVFDSVTPGAYELVTVKDGYGIENVEARVGDDTSNVQVQLTESAGATLHVADGRTGHDVTPRVVIFDHNGALVHRTPYMRTGADAGVALPLAPGSYTAYVAAQGLAPRNVTIVAPGEQRVTLTPGGRLRINTGRVGRRVRLLDASGADYSDFRGTDAIRYLRSDTSLDVQPIAAGAYTLQVLDSSNTVLDTRQVTIREGETVTVGL